MQPQTARFNFYIFTNNIGNRCWFSLSSFHDVQFVYVFGDTKGCLVGGRLSYEMLAGCPIYSRWSNQLFTPCASKASGTKDCPSTNCFAQSSSAGDSTPAISQALRERGLASVRDFHGTFNPSLCFTCLFLFKFTGSGKLEQHGVATFYPMRSIVWTLL